MTEHDISAIGQDISLLIREIDKRYCQRVFEDVEELESILEEQMEHLLACSLSPKV